MPGRASAGSFRARAVRPRPAGKPQQRWPSGQRPTSIPSDCDLHKLESRGALRSCECTGLGPSLDQRPIDQNGGFDHMGLNGSPVSTMAAKFRKTGRVAKSSPPPPPPELGIVDAMFDIGLRAAADPPPDPIALNSRRHAAESWRVRAGSPARTCRKRGVGHDDGDIGRRSTFLPSLASAQSEARQMPRRHDKCFAGGHA